MDGFASDGKAAYTTLDASGLSVGLPAGLMGNSEVGHLNIGAGRPIYQVGCMFRTMENKRGGGGVHLNHYSITVEPCYVELGYLELPAISNCFSLPLAQIDPGYLELYYVPKKHWSTSVRKCSQGISWQDVLKADKCVHANERKVRLTGLAAANAEGDKLPVFCNFREQTITRNLTPTSLSRAIFRYPWEFEIAGFYCISGRVLHVLDPVVWRESGMIDEPVASLQNSVITPALACTICHVQDIVRINMALEKGTFAKNEALIKAAERAKEKTGRLHFLGLVSADDAGRIYVHHCKMGSEKCIYTLLKYAKIRITWSFWRHVAILIGIVPPTKSHWLKCLSAFRFDIFVLQWDHEEQLRGQIPCLPQLSGQIPCCVLLWWGSAVFATAQWSDSLLRVTLVRECSVCHSWVVRFLVVRYSGEGVQCLPQLSGQIPCCALLWWGSAVFVTAQGSDSLLCVTLVRECSVCHSWVVRFLVACYSGEGVQCESWFRGLIDSFLWLQVSDGGVHSHISHLVELVKVAKELGVPKCFVQFFSDGRDTRPTSGGEF